MRQKNFRWPPQRRLKLYLVEHDIRHAWLAKETNVAAPTLGGVVSGRVRPTPRVRALIAQALGQTSGALFTDIEDPTDEELAEAEKAEQWRSTPRLDDATVEALRRLLFPAGGDYVSQRDQNRRAS
jgi:transcriptional regulator with XRE-family HTH domain